MLYYLKVQLVEQMSNTFYRELSAKRVVLYHDAVNEFPFFSMIVDNRKHNALSRKA